MPFNRRKFLKKSAATGAGVAIAGAAAAPAAEAAEGRKPGHPVKRHSLTVMGTTDLHGHVFNWDYFKDAEYADKAGNAMGLARISTPGRAGAQGRRAGATPCCWTPVTPSRAPRSPTTTPRSTRSPPRAARCTRWRRR